MPPLDDGLRDRVVLVTGAASGIGPATAELLAGMGAAVVATDVDAEAGASACAALADSGARVRFVAADVAEEGEVAGPSRGSAPTPPRSSRARR